MSKYNQQEEAILNRGYETGGFPIGKRQIIEIFEQNISQDFDELKERMRTAIMQIEHDNLTMEQVSSVAHICAVVAYKLNNPTEGGQ